MQEKIIHLINELESKTFFYARVNPSVSKTSVGWHIDHSLLVIAKIISSLQHSDPKEYKWSFSLSKLLVYTTNRIPRGRGKAPHAVQPANEITVSSLKLHIEEAKGKVRALSTLQADHHFKHPYFGDLNLKPAIKFLNLHTRHHLHIIEDMLSS